MKKRQADIKHTTGKKGKEQRCREISEADTAGEKGISDGREQTS